uniref:Uncharacterized protein n=1 Tax=Anguilla anguilla TaxID=7936 RepID=A0A0E9XRG7_ANGAN
MLITIAACLLVVES